MGSVNFIYPQGKPWMPRSYIRGFVLWLGIETVSLTGNILQFSHTGGVVVFQCQVSDVFLPSSSNSYSLDYVFDPDNCNAYINGVLAGGTLAMRVRSIPDHPDFWLAIDAGGVIDPSKRALLPALTGYWRPFAE